MQIFVWVCRNVVDRRTAYIEAAKLACGMWLEGVISLIGKCRTALALSSDAAKSKNR